MPTEEMEKDIATAKHLMHLLRKQIEEVNTLLDLLAKASVEVDIEQMEDRVMNAQRVPTKILFVRARQVSGDL